MGFVNLCRVSHITGAYFRDMRQPKEADFQLSEAQKTELAAGFPVSIRIEVTRSRGNSCGLSWLRRP
jgi:hypothetical protein